MDKATLLEELQNAQANVERIKSSWMVDMGELSYWLQEVERLSKELEQAEEEAA